MKYFHTGIMVIGCGILLSACGVTKPTLLIEPKDTPAKLHVTIVGELNNRTNHSVTTTPSLNGSPNAVLGKASMAVYPVPTRIFVHCSSYQVEQIWQRPERIEYRQTYIIDHPFVAGKYYQAKCNLINPAAAKDRWRYDVSIQESDQPITLQVIW